MKTIKAFKGFNRDMTCTPTENIKFQYEEGKEYEESGAIACKKGFHACEYPLDILGYYYPNKSVYHEVELSGTIDKSENDKTCASKIKIGAEISIAGLVKAAIEYTRVRTKKEGNSNDNYGASSATGNCGASSATGYKGKSTAGDPESVAVAWGYKSMAKGVLGSFLVFADWEGNENRYWEQEEWSLKGAKMVRVDNKNIKADTWYTMENGEVIEVKNGQV